MADFWERWIASSTDAFIAVDDHLRCVALNPRAASYLGLPSERIVGRMVGEVAGLAARQMLPDILKVLSTGKVVISERILHLPSGELLMRWSYRPVSEDGWTRYVVGHAREITGGELATASDDLIADLTDVGGMINRYIENSPLAVVRWDEDFRVAAWSQRASELFGWKYEEVAGLRPTEFGMVHPDDLELVKAGMEALLKGNVRGNDLLNRNRTKDGRTIVCHWFNSHLEQHSGFQILSLVEDVTDREAAQATLAEQAQRYRTLYVAAASAGRSDEQEIEATLVAGRNLLDMEIGTITEIGTPSARSDELDPMLCMLPLQQDEPVALADVAVDSPLATPLARPVGAYLGAKIAFNGVALGTVNFASSKPRRQPFTATDRELVQLMGAMIAGAIDRRRSRARLHTLAYRDSLTSLPNRAAMMEAVAELLGAGRRFGMVALDLDDFKKINDTQGHTLGDMVLREIATRLRECEDENTTVYRLGGDEFTIIAGDVNDASVLGDLAEGVRRMVDRPLHVSGLEHEVSASIGIVVAPDDGQDIETLFKHADIALYRAKELGRNRVQFFTAGLNTALMQRMAREKQLRAALKNHEFTCFYQPQFGIDGSLVGVEALARWRDPERGIVGPDTFITDAEVTGVIVPLGYEIIDIALRDAATWTRTLQPNLRVAINLSARQFYEEDLHERLLEALDRHAFPAANLEIEITESIAMDNAGRSVQILRDFRASGIRLALDDFGTGYSSLGYLRRFPLDTIKIDRSFVSDVIENREDQAIVRAVIAMAHSIGLEVCAEGVETVEQLDFLRGLGCELVQGYLLGHAVPAESIGRYITDGRMAASRSA